MKSAKKPAAPLIVKKSPDAQALKEQDAKFRSTFVEAMRSSSPPRSEPVVLPEAIVVPGVNPPAAPKPLPLVQPPAKTGAKAPAKAGAKKAAAKAGAKAPAKVGGKAAAKTGAKVAAKTGAKVGNLIMKRAEPLNLESVTSREAEEKEKEKEKEEQKALTERVEIKQELSVQTEEAKPADRLSLENMASEGLGVACRVPPVVKLIQTVGFKRLIKPNPDLYYCESVQSVFSMGLKPFKDLKVAHLDVKKFSALTKPPIGLFYTEQFAYRVMSKPNPKISYTEQSFSTYSVISPPNRNLYLLDTNNLKFEALQKPNPDFFLYIPFSNFPLAPTLELIEEFDLSSFSIKAITTQCLSFEVSSKPAIDMCFDEDCFTSKYPVVNPSVKLMKNLQIEEEDWNIRRGPPVIEILATYEFEMTSKPEVDFWFQQKEFVEMCLQTEELPEEPEEKPEEDLPEVLTFDQFIAKIEVTPKNSAGPVTFQFVDEAINRLSEMESIKKEVKDRESIKFKRNKAAVKVQAWVRGFLARRKYIPPILDVYRERLRMRRLAAIAVRIKRSWAPYVIFNALQAWYKMKLREKQRLYKLFLNFSAISIQKNWRGYIIRKFYRNKVLMKTRAKIVIRRMLRNWKCRKIMATRRLKHILKGLKDTKRLIWDLEYDRGSAKLYQQLQNQLVSYCNKLRVDFNTLYASGKWTNLPTGRDSISMVESTNSFKFQVIEEEPEEVFIPPNRSFLNREDIPIRPLAMNYEDLLKDFPEQPITTPPAKPRRKKLPIRKIDEKKVQEKEKESPKVFVFDENQEEVRQDDTPKEPVQPKQFLKRKSKSVKPQKVDWKVQRRIDCWLPKEKMKKKEPSFEIQNIIPKGDYMSLEEIEKEYQNDLSNWISLDLFFERTSREVSKIPQIEIESSCLKFYIEDNHTMHIEELESHYAYLCSEDVLSG